jgi:hypothetical protein
MNNNPLDNKNKLIDSVYLTLLTKLVTIIGIPALLAFMYWQANTTVESSKSIGTLTTSVSSLDKKVSEINNNMYTIKDAEKDFALRDNKIDDLDKRTTRIENQVFYGKNSPKN